MPDPNDYRPTIATRRRRRRIYPRLALSLALRSIGRGPAVPLLAALTLGLGFGAASSIYGVYTGFDRSLPVPDGSDVQRVRVLDTRGRAVPLTARDTATLVDATDSFDRLGAFATTGWTVRVGERGAVRIAGAAMTPAAFALLRVEPQIGRLPRPGDTDAIVVSHEFWSEYLEGDEAILGADVLIEGTVYTLIGIMPPGHRFPFNQRAWTLLDERSDQPVELVARLAPGRTAAQAATDVERVLEGERFAAGVEVPDLRVDVLGFTLERGEGGENAALATLLSLVVALVLVSCSNVSNLLLARALARSEQLLVHAALGAGPGQLVVQMFLEALLIALAGAVVGLGLASVAIGYIETTLAGNWGYYWMRVAFESRVVLFTLALAVCTGLVAGLVPAVRLGRADLAEALKSGAAGVIGGSRRNLSSVLLNAQVAFSCFALIIAMLLAGALLRSQVADDFPADRVFVAGVSLSGEAYAEAGSRRAFRQALLADLEGDARVDAVALSNVVPSLATVGATLEIEGAARAQETAPARVPVVAVTPGYFEMFGIGILSGRALQGDTGPVESVAAVSESFAREHLSSAEPIGQRIRLQQVTGDAWLRVVGVVSDRPVYEGARTRELARVYLPFGLVDPADHFVLFTARDAAPTIAVRRAIAGLDPDVAVTSVFGISGETRVADVIDYVRRIFETAGTLGMLGGLGAAIVALIGLYGALAFEVQRRLAEVGVRMALGASGRDVTAHFARTGLKRVAPGLLIGFVLSAGIGPLLGFLLGDMDPRDPLIYLGVYLAFFLVAVAATAVPGRRAARLDLVSVLRGD